MINMILCILFQAIPGPFCGMGMEKILTPDNERSTRWQRILWWSLLWLAACLIRIPLALESVMAITNILTLVEAGVILKYCYTDKLKKKWLTFILMLALMIMADLLVTISCFIITDGRKIVVAYTTRETAVASAVVSLITVIFYFVVSEISYRYGNKRKNLKYLLIFTGVVLSEIPPLFWGYYYIYKGGKGLAAPNYIIFNTVLFSIFAFAVILFNQSEKDAIENELREVRHISELEQVHYQEIEKRREEMAKIRHDYNNLLSSVLILIHAGKTDETEQMLSELSARIENTKEYPYCGIPIINAVLSEKNQLCDKHGIHLAAELFLPDTLSISNLDLCSALGNLLDNAIRACKKMELEEKPEIRLSCGIVGDYLVVKSVNPSTKAPGEKPEGTGYGLRILNDLAKRYRGDFFTEYKDGIFTAQLSLQMENSEKTKLV